MLTPLLDAYGNCHRPITSNQVVRIVSLVPSITELLCDLGLTELIVGRTGFCIHPDTLHTIPKIGGTKDVNIEKIRRLNPTHLIVNIDENEKTTVDLLAQFIPHIIVTHPILPRDNLDLYLLLGKIFQVESSANRLCQALEASLEHVKINENRKNVLYCIWKDPWMSISKNTYIAQMLALRNWQSITFSSPSRYPIFEWNDPALQSLDVILLSTEPYRFTDEHVLALKKMYDKPVLLVDGEMLSWYGSRAIKGLHYLQQLQLD